MVRTCPSCGGTDIEADPSLGAACRDCGHVLEESTIVSEVSFQETGRGKAVVVGQYVPSTGMRQMSLPTSALGYSKMSRDVTIENGRRLITRVAGSLGLGKRFIEAAQRLFLLAIQHNFIQGRKTENVVSACLYIVCRRERTSHMIIDFSDVLQTNVFALGNTFLKFVRLLNITLPLVDPSLYIYRFAGKLEFGKRTHMVAMTALRIAAMMKQDWLTVGRQPIGICAACLLIAARAHGFRRTQQEIVNVIHVCGMTLRKRLHEWSDTKAAGLTFEEFFNMDSEMEMATHADSLPPAFIEAEKRRVEGAALTSGDEGKQIQLGDPRSVVKSQARMMELMELENDKFTDINDEEIDQYLIKSEKEVEYRERMWTAMNSDYLEAQKMKEQDREKHNTGTQRKRKAKKEVKVGADAVKHESALEATASALGKRKLSGRINYKALEGLFDYESILKKRRT